LTSHHALRIIVLERGTIMQAQTELRDSPALAAALNRIEQGFGPAYRIAAFKCAVRTAMHRGAGHPDVMYRYRQIAASYPDITVTAAATFADLAWRNEAAARETSIAAWGFCHRPRLKLTMLAELRLMLRWMRRYAPGQFAAARDIVIGPHEQVFSEAAE
jgi:hypothetical protein